MSAKPQSSSRSIFGGMLLGVALVLPTLVTLVYFQWLDGTDSWLQQSAYAMGKLLQFGFPIVWVLALDGAAVLNEVPLKKWMPPGSESETERGVGQLLTPIGTRPLAGIAFGLFVVAAMLTLFFGWLGDRPVGERMVAMVETKVASLGIDSTWKFAALGLFYSLGHSLLEEYYWRWFTYRLGRPLIGIGPSNVVSSIGFAAHHILLLGFFLGWTSPWTYLGTAAIAIGGSVWAWQYERSGSLLTPWLGHLVVDAGIFGLGYWLVRESFSSV